MAEFQWQNNNNNVGASHHHSSSFMGMGVAAGSNNIQTNAAAPPHMMSTFDTDDAHHHFSLSLLDHSFSALHHHNHPQALSSAPFVETPSASAAAAAGGGISCISSSCSLSFNEKVSSSSMQKKKKKKKKAWEKEEVVHVRPRKGQATDSHSAAERVRREKINRKLRCLRELVPGCHKSMGMAVMLEEIINYVYSLQNQVEFLSMELAAAATANSVNLATQPSRSASRASLQGKSLADGGGKEGYGDATNYFHTTTTTASMISKTTWSI